MLLEENDFGEVFGAGGERFERMIKDLVRSEARRLGLAENDIHWDQRTSVADDGCDIWITRGHDDNASFLPVTPTSLSLKSGIDGTKPAKFESEVLEHSTLISRLKAGKSFLWCCPRPISQPKRVEFAEKAEELAIKLGCDENLFKFFWIDAISEALERSPHLIADHLPVAWKRLEGLSLVKNWKPDDREPVRVVPEWVDFGGRDSIKQGIRKHLLGATSDRLLHIAGLSGSGKTRTVVEACREESLLAEVVYCPKLSDTVDRLLTHLNAMSGRALLIIDEVPLDDYEILARRIERLPETVRAVSIGPARANEAQREGILILAPPERTDDVAAVARSVAGPLGDDVLKSIASFAGKDLRLALLLVEATLKTQAPHYVPIGNQREVWTRIQALFARDIKHPEFAHHYTYLTTTIDIGVGRKAREELTYIAKHFEKSIGTMEDCVRDAVRTGLGAMPYDHFEATPRALARWVFFNQAWPAIKHRIDQFLTDCPERLRKRFLDRCQELPDRERQEVMTVVRDFFLRHFGDPNLSRLSEGKTSKLFQTWAETDPQIGLEWLVRATAASTIDDLAKFNGENNYAGGWNGRRQVVWLCEHLSCFKECFSQAEDVLFRLSHVETEKSISNNGTNTWKALFHPLLSYTEVPFDARLALLIKRLQTAEGRSLELVVAAALAMLSDGGMRAIPPAVVGGRVRPTEWQPKTRGELFDWSQTGGRKFIKAVRALTDERQQFVLNAIVPEIGRFLDLDLFDELRRWIADIAPDKDTARKLRKEVDSWLSWRAAHMTGNGRLVALVDAVQEWRDSIEPRTVIERAKDLTSRDYWENLREFSRSGDEVSHEEATRQTDAVYRSVAEELLNDFQTISLLEEWLNSEDNKSGDVLAQHIARLDSEGKTYAIFARWIVAGKALLTCAGYLRGLNAAQGRVKIIDAALERLVETEPDAALRLTASGDFSEVGFDRIIRCLESSTPEGLWGLRPLVTYSWRDLFTEHRVLRLAQKLRRLQQLEGFRKMAGVVAVDVLHLIYSQKTIEDPVLASVILSILADATDLSNRRSWDWVHLAKAVQSHDPKAICRLAMYQLIRSRVGFDDSLEEFVNECARSEPDEAMAFIGEELADEKRRWSFRVIVFRGLFDSIGVRTVSRYLETHPDHAPFIARHLDGPSIGESDMLQIPELADWMMTRFVEEPEVWREFMMGRHAFEVFSVPDGYEKAKETAARFIHHPKAWVRKWAEAEIKNMDWEIEVHRREVDRRDRE